jgi:hypothetical protein
VKKISRRKKAAGKTSIDDPLEGDGRDPKVADRQVAFSFTRNLLASPADADRFAELFMVLYLALDERSVSYAQGTLQVVVDPSTAERVRVKLEELGVPATVKDL